MDDRLLTIMKKMEGLTEAKAGVALQHFPYHIRVVKRDGVEQYKPSGFDPVRVNVEVEDGVITLVRDLG